MKSVFLIVSLGGVVMVAALVGQPQKASQITQVIEEVESRLDKIHRIQTSLSEKNGGDDGLQFSQAGFFDPMALTSGDASQNPADPVILRDLIRIPPRSEVRNPYKPSW